MHFVKIVPCNAALCRIQNHAEIVQIFPQIRIQIAAVIPFFHGIRRQRQTSVAAANLFDLFQHVFGEAFLAARAHQHQTPFHLFESEKTHQRIQRRAGHTVEPQSHIGFLFIGNSQNAGKTEFSL